MLTFICIKITIVLEETFKCQSVAATSILKALVRKESFKDYEGEGVNR